MGFQLKEFQVWKCLLLSILAPGKAILVQTVIQPYYYLSYNYLERACRGYPLSAVPVQINRTNDMFVYL